MNEKWMCCTCCHAVVQLNATGICLGCQGGFCGQLDEDKYKPEEELKGKELSEVLITETVKKLTPKPKKRTSKNEIKK